MTKAILNDLTTTLKILSMPLTFKPTYPAVNCGNNSKPFFVRFTTNWFSQFQVTFIYFLDRNHQYYVYGKDEYSSTCYIQILMHKFGNGWIISSHTLLGMWLLIPAGIKANPCKMGLCDVCRVNYEKQQKQCFVNRFIHLLKPLWQINSARYHLRRITARPQYINWSTCAILSLQKLLIENKQCISFIY